MLRYSASLALIAATAAAQDHIIAMGFADANGGNGGVNSAPAARVKDGDLDGIVNPVTEIHSFLTTSFNAGTNAQGTALNPVCFMTDVRMVVVNGEYEFYFTDSEHGRIVRGIDKNHNGLLDRGEDLDGDGVLDPGEDTNGNNVLDTEVNEYLFLGVRANQVNLLAPDTLAVYRDTVTGQTRVYVALDNNTDPSYGFSRGIYRCVDLNNDGDAKDAGETTPFVNSGMGLTVPGTSGPVALSVADNWTQMRMLPGGKLVAYAQGGAVTTGGAIQPSMNAFYGFTDNNGTAVPEVWFNCSLLNALPQHPDWANNTFPNWDVFYGTGQRNFVRWMAVAPHGGIGNAVPAYYIGASYNVVPGASSASAPGDVNINGQSVAGLVYKVNDFNFNQVIDPGELSLYCNISGTTYAGVAPVGFTNQVGTVISSLVDRTWGMDVTDNGEVSFTYANGGPDSVFVMRDLNQNEVIEAGEVTTDFAATTLSGPFSSSPFYNYHLSITTGTLPGPFPVGIVPSGEGCIPTSAGMRVVMDAWGGVPQIGNSNFKVGPIRGLPGSIGVLALAAGLGGPFPMTLIGGPVGCAIHLDAGSFSLMGFTFTDVQGRTIFSAPIPSTPALIGAVAAVQGAVFDPATPAPLQYHTSNALLITIQP